MWFYFTAVLKGDTTAKAVLCCALFVCILESYKLICNMNVTFKPKTSENTCKYIKTSNPSFLICLLTWGQSICASMCADHKFRSYCG